MSNHERVGLWNPALKQEAYELRVQGLTPQDIADTLAQRHGLEIAPSRVTIWRWLTSEEAKPLLQLVEHRVRAKVAHAADALLGDTYDAIGNAIAAGDLKSADAGSRVVVNLTRGIITERVEMTAPKTSGDSDELARLLATHGVTLTPEPSKNA